MGGKTDQGNKTDQGKWCSQRRRVAHRRFGRDGHSQAFHRTIPGRLQPRRLGMLLFRQRLLAGYTIELEPRAADANCVFVFIQFRDGTATDAPRLLRAVTSARRSAAMRPLYAASSAAPAWSRDPKSSERPVWTVQPISGLPSIALSGSKVKTTSSSPPCPTASQSARACGSGRSSFLHAGFPPGAARIAGRRIVPAACHHGRRIRLAPPTPTP